MNRLILNRVAIWRATPIDKMTIKQYPAGISYVEDNIVKVTDDITFRYAKNYKIGKGKNAPKICLYIATYSDDKKKVASYLDSVASKVTVDKAKEFSNDSEIAINYLDEYYQEGK